MNFKNEIQPDLFCLFIAKLELCLLIYMIGYYNVESKTFLLAATKGKLSPNHPGNKRYVEQGASPNTDAENVTPNKGMKMLSLMHLWFIIYTMFSLLLI